MENASKALIIAGAILLSILIISLGIMIYNQASGVVNNNAVEEVEVQQFNEKFSQYFGEHVSGANVNALVNRVRTNNNKQDDVSKKVVIKQGSNDAEITLGNKKTNTEDDINSIEYFTAKTGATYIVGVSAYSTGGLISEITVNEITQ